MNKKFDIRDFGISIIVILSGILLVSVITWAIIVTVQVIIGLF